MSLRDARPQDRQPLVDLWVAAWTLAMPGIDFLARRAWLETFLDELEAAGAHVLLAEIDGRPAGFLTLDPGRTSIDQLAVHPSFQGRGIASRLLDRAKTLAPGGLDLIVNRDNAPARCLYARQGFVETSEGRNETSGLPTITMRWDPPPRGPHLDASRA